MSNPFFWLILQVIDLYMWLVIIGVVLSWLVTFKVVNLSNRFVYMVGELIDRLTEPALRPIRQVLPNLGNLDISPVVLILLLMFAQRFIIWILLDFG
jgi:YggT family protein